jgi:hypothetical protein
MEDIIIRLMEQALSGEMISAHESEQIYQRLDNLKKQLRGRVRVTDDDRERWRLEDEKKIEDYGFGGEGCDTCSPSMPGVIFPIAPNYNEDHAWVERCSSCDTFESDLHAALFLGRMLGCRVRVDYFDTQDSSHPYLEGLTLDEAEDVMDLINKKHKELLKAAKEIKHGAEDDGESTGSEVRVHAVDPVVHEP